MEKRVKGVVISDGFTVVLTDVNGNYELMPNEKAKSIFMSTPAGYEFKTDYSVAKQYQDITIGTSYDFKLQALKAMISTITSLSGPIRR
jgi:hypothetical protein